MADLRDLHAALASMRDSARTGRVSFFHLDEAQKMHSGYIFVEDGTTCYVHLRDLEPHAALDAIAGMKFAKVTSLPSMHADHAGDVEGVPMEEVLARLDPSLRPAEPEPPARVAPPAANAPAGEAREPAPAAAAKPAHVFYSHIAMQKDALGLLEPLFGTGAAKKVEEFARQSPPHQYPADFLGKCRQQAAMMLGARKAEELFQPIFDRLSH